MKNKLYTVLVFLFSFQFIIAQEIKEESNTTYKKRVLENVELDFMSSFYKQSGNNAAVTGGIGTEELTDVTPTITLSIPLNDDDVLVIDAGISAYSSASSSNLDPFDNSGASRGGDDDDDDDHGGAAATGGSPWVASSGESKQDVWGTFSGSYSHSSNDRNKVWSANVSFAAEYDYISFGFGGGFTQLFNEKNTEIGIKGSVFLDNWNPVYPTEIDSYIEFLNGESDFFSNVEILNRSGAKTNINGGAGDWSPVSTVLVESSNRNSYSFSLSFSQILSSRAQISIFADAVSQQGWLSNPMQRVYFSDRPNYYIGDAASIPNYTSKTNRGVFHLADDIERLPNSRLKLPIGARLNYYVNEYVVLRTYYRYYSDDWGVKSQTMEIEIPVKIKENWTVMPSYRYYDQTAADYFAPYNKHLSTSKFYTSDYDLSEFNSKQMGLMIRYTDIFTQIRVWEFGLKKAELKYSNYERNSGFRSGIISLGVKFVMD
ncbi:DUF3570 domain-containing protein [Bacteroidota bacterium]